jgi:cystathionine gamma-lyase
VPRFAQHPATRVVHAGLPAAEQGRPLLPGPVFAAPFHLRGDVDATPYGYGRYDNPTFARYEAALGDLEGGRATVFASGMAAASAVLLSLTRPGDVVVLPSDGYGTVRAVGRLMAERRIEVREVLSRDEEFRAALPGARLVWVETPTNPGLDVLDVEALAGAARAAGALLAVDATLATPLALRPLELGAHLSMSSDSKAMTGHSDLVLGHVATGDDELFDAVRSWRTVTGGVPGPLEVWLAHRSLATLDVRLDRMCSNALAIAAFLESHPAVTRVRYPGLPGDPSHEVASRQMSRFGHVVSFDLGERAAAERFLAASRLVAEATSFGGVHTTGERRARWGGDAVGEGFIRLSAGVEHPDDLLDDLAAALAG